MFGRNRRINASINAFPALRAIVLIGLGPGGAFAQTTSGQIDRDAQRILEQQQQQVRDRANQFRDARDRAPSGDEVGPQARPTVEDSGCAAIRDVRVAGMTRYREADFASELGALKGPCTHIKAIDAALRAMTNRYVRDGFVTSRALIGPQDLKDGVLTITVIEGRIGAIKTAPGRLHYGPQEIAAAFPAARDDVLNLRARSNRVSINWAG